jgi:hypothetical protein
MANSDDPDGERWVRRRRRSRSGLDEKLCESGGNGKERDPAEVRRFRRERHDRSRSTHRTASTSKMTSASHATLPSIRSAASHRRRKDRHRSPERKHHNRRQSTVKEEPATYVYGAPEGRTRPSRILATETRKLGRDGESTESQGGERSTQSEPVKEKTRKVKVVYVTAEEARALENKERKPRTSRESSNRPRDSGESVHRSRAHRSRRKSVSEAPPSPLKRYAPISIGSSKS